MANITTTIPDRIVQGEMRADRHPVTETIIVSGYEKNANTIMRFMIFVCE